MIDPVMKYIPEFVNSGSDIITIHHEIDECVTDANKINQKI